MVDQGKIAKDWEERGFSCDLWTDPPGQVWEGFVHPVDEVVVLVEGRIELEIEGQTVHPEPGEEIFIPAHAVHSVRNIGGVTVHWLYGYRKEQM